MADDDIPKPLPKIAHLGETVPWKKIKGGYNGPLAEQTLNTSPNTNIPTMSKPLASPAPPPKKPSK